MTSSDGSTAILISIPTKTVLPVLSFTAVVVSVEWGPVIVASQGTYFALSITIGMTISKFHSFDYYEVSPNIFILFSVHAKLRNADPGYDFTSSFFLRCLYEGESGDPNAPDVGFLNGPLLIHVSTFCPYLF